MKYIVFFAFKFLATVRATTVKFGFNDDYDCQYLKESHPYDKCGVNPISFNDIFDNVTSALITDNEMGVVFYDEKDCNVVNDKGEESLTYEVRGPVQGKKCYVLGKLIDFPLLCIKILC